MMSSWFTRSRVWNLLFFCFCCSLVAFYRYQIRRLHINNECEHIPTANANQTTDRSKKLLLTCRRYDCDFDENLFICSWLPVFRCCSFCGSLGINATVYFQFLISTTQFDNARVHITHTSHTGKRSVVKSENLTALRMTE